MTSHLPLIPSLEHLRKQARALLNAYALGDKRAIHRVRTHHPAYKNFSDNKPSSLKLQQAQLVIARELGFVSWAKLKIQVELLSKTYVEKLDLFLSSSWMWGNRQRAELLLTSNPELSSANIFSACATGDVGAVKKILASDPKKARESGGALNRVPLIYCTWSCFLNEKTEDMVEVCHLLLNAGADPNSFWVNESGQKESALYGCVEANCAKMAELLIRAGADPNDGESLYHACEKNSLELLNILARNDIKLEDLSYCIKHAMDYKWTEGIKWFLAQGADPNSVHPKSGETSLHWAIKRNCSTEIIEDLLRAGGDPNLKTKEGQAAYLGITGWTPYDFAMRLGLDEIADLLVKYGAKTPNWSDYDQFIFRCAKGQSGDLDFVKKLTENDKTLIAHAAQMRHWDAVRVMVELGWPIDAKGWMDGTALYWAICLGEVEMVDFLLSEGASTLPIGGYFKNPIHTVVHCQWGKTGYLAVLKSLLENGVKIPNGFYPCGKREFDELMREYSESV